MNSYIRSIKGKLPTSIVATLVASAMVLVFLFSTQAHAGTGIGTTVTMPSAVTVGDSNVAGSITFVNTSTTPDDVGTVTISSIQVKTTASNSGVFAVDTPSTGVSGTCGAASFTFTPAGAGTWNVAPSVVLGAPGVSGTCQINFTFDVLAFPGADDNGALTGTQAFLSVAGNAVNNTTGAPGNAAGTGQTTVSKASPGIQTTPSAGGNVGVTLNDTATLTGGSTPTGSVTFKLFPPSDSTCIGTASYTDTDPTAPYATNPGFVSNAAGVWHWTADYLGDANNNAVSSPCTAEPVTVTAQSHIIVDKVTNPSGDTQSFAFTTTGSGYSGFSLTDAAAPNDQTLNAGSYSVAETLPSGWTQTSATCVSSIQDTETIGALELDAGETITCTFTNTKKGHIIVDKITNPSGASQSFAFTATGAGYSNFSLTDAAAPNNQEVVPGAYTISEGAVAGWASDGGVCDNGETPGSIDVGPGETITCTFTNTLQQGHIIVDKVTSPSGDTQSFAFTTTGAGYNGFSLTDAAAPNDQALNAGTYSVAETPITGWTQTSATCDGGNTPAGISLTAGGTVHCTFVNTKVVNWCSPGYWRNHLDAWGPTGISPTAKYSAYFAPVVLSKKAIKDGAFSDPTLLQVLQHPDWYGGEAFNNVGDLLSSHYPGFNFTLGDPRIENCPLN